MLVNISVFLRHTTRPLLACLASKQFFVSIVRDDAGMVHTHKRRKSPHGQFPKFHFPRSGICIKQLNSRRHTPSFSRTIGQRNVCTEKDKFVFSDFLAASRILPRRCISYVDVASMSALPEYFRDVFFPGGRSFIWKEKLPPLRLSYYYPYQSGIQASIVNLGPSLHECTRIRKMG